MDQKINNSQNEFLWSLLANPANDAHLYSHNLQRLVNDFPQSGVLQALLAHASEDKNLKRASVYFDAKSLYKLINTPSALTGVPTEKIIIQPVLSDNGRHQNSDTPPVAEPVAAADQFSEGGVGEKYFSDQSEGVSQPETPVQEHIPDTLVNQASSLPVNGLEKNDQQATDAASEIVNHVEDKKDIEAGIVGMDSALLAYTGPAEGEPENIEPETANQHHGTVDNQSATEDIHSSPGVNEPANEIKQEAAEESQPALESSHSASENNEAENEFEQNLSQESRPATENYQSIPDNNDLSENEAPLAVDKKDQPEEAIAHKRFPPAPTHNSQPEKEIEDETYDEIVGIENISLKPDETKAPDEADKLKGEEEKLILTNIAADDFFMFDRAFGEHTPSGQPGNNGQSGSSVQTPGVPGKHAASTIDNENQDLSKYNDEKMPYTFMWWLDKTRKEHAGISQPYAQRETGVSVSKPKNIADELQQQYYENIFHITPSVEEPDKSAAHTSAPFTEKRKEHIIIERFIQEEPQIKPQSSDKLDNENKAKKSSEDRDELVTETLAGIYSDQMLYHKAIASYKKLMLKFPEKSRYFAGKIEQLEKKTN